jgi:iron complex outermembrane receptor protein
MTLNVAAFVNEYSDVKAQLFAVACNDPTLGLTVIECVAQGISTTFEYYENSGGVDTSGVEVELQWAPTDNWFISANLSLMSSEFSSDFEVGDDLLRPLLGLGNLEGRQDINDPNSRFSFAGWAPALSPETTFGFQTSYDINLSGGSVLTPSISVTAVDDYYAFDTNIPEAKQSGYTNVDARLTWYLEDAGIAIDAFVMNATDEQVLTRVVVHSQIVSGLPANSVQANWNNPRTYGVSFRYNF